MTGALFKRWAMERVRGESAASRRAGPSCPARAPCSIGCAGRAGLRSRGGARVGASVASGPSGAPSRPGRRRRRAPATSASCSWPAPDQPAVAEQAAGALVVGRLHMPYRQLPPPQRWDPRAQRFEGWTELTLLRVLRLPRDPCARQRPCKSSSLLLLVSYRPLAINAALCGFCH